jgi:hypothetical protein
VGEDSGEQDENGVDRSLIRWFLELTPVERLAWLDEARELAELAAKTREPSA